ncbi:unnamed protein product [Cladocopium goreaui]|uniref:Major facilitator superfamily (MFS) profile domain-containing protein n=1 Tax=Cladocopium goreaui TaxID=2562237 RepID=A0A9P1BKG4_9DINO|nr:unnamed protein product [Cladocopium goreaui]
MSLARHFQLARRVCLRCGEVQEDTHTNSSMRWVALGILSLDICVSYVPQYTFVPILRQGMHSLHVDEAAMNFLCILYALVYVPGAFVTGPLVSVLGCRWTFILATLLIALGCAVRTAAWNSPLEAQHFGRRLSVLPKLFESELMPSWMSNSPFVFLVFGQALCALGQPLLVNCTSEMGADWFSPTDRPAAAMISNLMNFVGGSLSFVLPPLFVDDNPTDFVVMNRQISSLLSFQFHSAMVAFTLTFLLYQSRPVSAKMEKRPTLSFINEVKGILRKSDFWIINFQFMIYISIGHAFDAVEGSLLENYGYNASLTSWTAMSCAITSILSTIVEARFITSATYYKAALLISNAFMAASLLAGYMCLHYGMSPWVFIGAVGIMGLSTPGWGCSAELGSEVCFPAREATVNSLLEAFSNMAGVMSIVWAQEGIDAHLGAAVLAVMAVSAMLGMAVLLFLSGHLSRTETEKSPKAAEVEEEGMSHMVQLEQDRRSTRHRTKVVFVLWAIAVNFVSLLITATTAQFMPVIFSEPQLPQIVATGPKKAKKRPTRLKNGVKEPRTWLLNCGSEKYQTTRREKIMSIMSSNTSLAFFPCLKGRSNLHAAIKDGLLPQSALMAFSRSPGARLELAKAASHMKLWKFMVMRNIPAVSILEDSESLCWNFRQKRNELLGKLPLKTDFVAFNPLKEVGQLDQKLNSKKHGNSTEKRKKANTPIFRLKPGKGLPQAFNNYYITLRYAKKLLRIGSGFDASQGFSEFVFNNLYRSPQARGFRGYALPPAVLGNQSAHVATCS